MADTTLTPEEMKFFETGELQPGMQAAQAEQASQEAAALAATQASEAAALAAAEAAKQVAAQPTPAQQTFNTEAADILRQSLEEAQRRVGALEANLAELSKKPDPVIQAPDPDTDPLGAMMHQLNTVNKTVADLQAALQAQQAQASQLTAFQQFQAQVGQLRDTFAKSTPDFPDAYAHMRNARIADLRAFGLTDDKVQQTLFQEEATLAQNAIRFGKNPAEVVYDMAKRHGYTPKAAPTANAPTTPDAKLASIQQAQNASKTLPTTHQLEDITVDGLKAASEADLNKLVADDKMWAKITGADQYPI